MFYLLSKTLDVALAPLSWAVALMLLSLARTRRWARWTPIAAVLVLYVFSIEPVSNGLVRHLEAEAVPSLRAGVTYDAVVLLGGVVDHRATATHDVPSYNDNSERLLTSFDLLRSGRARDVIISGGKAWPDDPVVEAHVLGKQLEDWGIAHERIVLEDRATNTRENAVESKRLAEEHHYRSLLVVTSAAHMPRALECFREVGLSVDALPVDYHSFTPSHQSYLPRAAELADSTAALRELFGSLVYRVMGFGKR